MRIHWLSNATWAGTGYGVQSKLFLPRLIAAGHDVTATDFYGLEGGVQKDAHGITHYPKGGHPYGVDIVGPNAQHAGAEIGISLIDAWVMEPNMFGPNIPWCPWFPVDSEPIPPPVLAKIQQAFRPITYAKFGVEMCKAAGVDVAYVPHGVDTKVYKPIGRDEARKALNWNPDKFVFGMVAANKGTPSRKCYPQQLEAFARFAQTHPDALLYIHCNGIQGQMQGVNLPELCQFLGIADKVLFAEQYTAHLGFSDEHMVNVYNAMDCLLSISMGEGFGVPILEAQACGTFVLTGDWTAMSEITWNGYALPKECAEPYWTGLASKQYVPRIDAIVGALELAYREAPKFKGIVPAQVAEYDADYVTEHYWQPVVADIAARMEFQRQMASSVMIQGVAA